MSGVLDNAKVGDILLVTDGMSEYLEKVERITQTLVATKSHRFNKANGNQYGGMYWNTFHARLATDEDVAKIKRRQMIRRVSDINFSLLSDSQLEQILEIVNPDLLNGK